MLVSRFIAMDVLPFDDDLEYSSGTKPRQARGGP
jgi:hypothetical protein